MHWYKFLLLYLWIAPHVLLAVVAVLLLKKHLYTTFPVFTIYAWYEIAEFAVLLAISLVGLNKGDLYVRVFLATLAVSAVLRFGVLQEVFNNVFREHGQVDVLARISLRWTTGFLLAAAVLGSLFALAQPAASVISGLAWLGRGIAVIQVGLVLFLLLFSRVFGVSLQSYVFGIALSFGILSSVELANWAMHASEITRSMARMLNLLPTGAYHIAVLLWLGYLILPAREIFQARDVPVVQVDQWNQELERYLR